MRLTAEALKIQDPARVCNEIETFIRRKVDELQRDGAAVALSGGLDSSTVAYLCARSVGPNRVLGINMPERGSDPRIRNKEDAELVAQKLEIRFERKDLTPALEVLDVYKLIPSLPGWIYNLYYRFTKAIGKDQYAGGLLGAKNKFTARGRAYANSKHRLRLVYLYLRAEAENLLVVGSANKTEYLTGFFVKGGVDAIADIMPIRHLYKPQVRQLAEYIGVPEAVIEKPASADVLRGITDEDVLGSHETAALILFGLENGLSCEEISRQLNLPGEKVRRFRTLMEYSRHMRESPYVI